MSSKSTIATGIALSEDMRAIDRVIKRRLQNVDASRSMMFLIEDVPADALPFIARQWGVFNIYELALEISGVDQARTILRKLIEIERFRGTAYAVREAVVSVGFDGVEVEDQNAATDRFIANGVYFADGTLSAGQGHWAYFDVRLTQDVQWEVNPDDLRLIRFIVDRYKNVRSRLIDIFFSKGSEDFYSYEAYCDSVSAEIQGLGVVQDIYKSETLKSGEVLYSASGGMVLDGKRIDRIVPLTVPNEFGERDAIFTGTDRPFYNKTIDGFSQISVEKTAKNFILNSATVTTQTITLDATGNHTLAFEGTGEVVLSGGGSGTLTGVDGERVTLTFEATATSVTVTVSGEVLRGQVEEGNYATLWIPTEGSVVTRLAPAPVIEDALPLNGTIAIVANIVRDVGSNTILTTGGDIFELRSEVRIQADNRVRFSIYGFEGGAINQPQNFWNELYSRRDVTYVATYNNSHLRTFIFDFSNKNLYTEITPYVQNNISLRNITLGGSSTRAEVPFYVDGVARVNDSADQWKRFIEKLTSGTSQETKASEITIV